MVYLQSSETNQALASLRYQPFSTIDEFVAAVRALEPGATLVYFVGDLGFKRGTDSLVKAIANKALMLGTPFGVPIRPATSYASNGHKIPLGEGFGYLTQRKLRPGMYEYLLTRADL